MLLINKIFVLWLGIYNKPNTEKCQTFKCQTFQIIVELFLFQLLSFPKNSLMW